MSISFYIKNKRKIIAYEPVLTVKEALALSDKELNVFAISDIDINKLLLSPLSDYECLLIGVKNKSARGFELSYDKKNKDYVVRIFTPSSREDWLLALDYIKTLAKKFNSEIENNRGEIYTIKELDKFDYESDILYGISSISAKINDREGAQYIILGINRLVVFNKKMLDKIYSSGNTIDAFSTIVREIQYLDASSAPQNFFKNNDNGKIMGNYTLVEGVRTILPYIPNVEFENSNIVKNEDISVWNITLLIIELNKNDGKNYYCSVGNLEYDKFIKKIPTDKYKFIDGAYIMLEPLTKEEILKLLDGE
ncbi:DUF4299 family protein [Fusobacterium periodonticum]|uniref:Uncharacterized protein n=1 Tax=Fusobacterium periodonticum 1_1_41FAA TaxID=469621 RepID=D6LF29_9FUSO|nr:DUF4299 family protein [Fusobacterium periodonticum]EFG28764.1 hypothetical protein HMPREF0400_00317 [Fusobacterium periodonticum 1_1_41FAA]